MAATIGLVTGTQVILLVNALGSGYCVVRLTQIALATRSTRLRSIVAPIIPLAAVYCALFIARLIVDGHQLPGWWSEVGRGTAMIVWWAVWIRPALLFDRVVRGEKARVDASAKNTKRVIDGLDR